MLSAESYYNLQKYLSILILRNKKQNNRFYFREVNSYEKNKTMWKSIWSKKKIFNRLFK